MTATVPLHHVWPPYCRVNENASDCDEERRAKGGPGKIRFRKDRCGQKRRSREPVFINRDVELVMRGGGRHSREEVDYG